MELDLKGKRALVIGAWKGIGRACAEALARDACALGLTGVMMREPMPRSLR